MGSRFQVQVVTGNYASDMATYPCIYVYDAPLAVMEQEFYIPKLGLVPICIRPVRPVRVADHQYDASDLRLLASYGHDRRAQNTHWHNTAEDKNSQKDEIVLQYNPDGDRPW